MKTKKKITKKKPLEYSMRKYSAFVKQNTEIMKYSNDVIDEALCNEPHSSHLSNRNRNQNSILFQQYFGLKMLLGYFIGPRHPTFDAVFDTTEKVIAKSTKNIYRIHQQNLPIILNVCNDMNYSRYEDAEHFMRLIEKIIETKHHIVHSYIQYSTFVTSPYYSQRSLLTQQILSHPH